MYDFVFTEMWNLSFETSINTMKKFASVATSNRGNRFLCHIRKAQVDSELTTSNLSITEA